MASPMAGAWELISDTHDGIMVLTDTHFASVLSPKNRNPFAGDNPTPVEALEAYMTISSLAGIYTTNGSTAVFHRVANSRVETAGQPMTTDFVIEGDQMAQVVLN